MGGAAAPALESPGASPFPPRAARADLRHDDARRRSGFHDAGGWLGGGRFADGFAFSIPLLTILGVHELGHYVMCRRYGLAATLPIFLPSPIAERLRNVRGRHPDQGADPEQARAARRSARPGRSRGSSRRCRFFSTAWRTRASTTPLTPGTILFDYPLIVRWAQDWTDIGPYTSASVHEHPTFMAAWFGLIVTAMNLFPLGQLDGSHVMRAVLGRRQPFAAGRRRPRRRGLSGPARLVVFRCSSCSSWGPAIRPMPDDDEPLGFGRKLVALGCIGVFLLCFRRRFVRRSRGGRRPPTSAEARGGRSPARR